MTLPAPVTAPLAPIAPHAAFSAPQGDARVPKAFQTTIIDGLCRALQSPARPPCLLRSPTGSGKTFMLTRTLQRISGAAPTLWLWFVPFVNLVAQTIDSLDSEGAGLVPVPLALALNEQPTAGLVLLSTVQGVASAKARRSGYTSAEDDDKRSMAAYVARARSAGLAIGVVVDEAHIALRDETEFGQFVHWLQADYLLMASATPRDARLSQFIETAGYSHFETFSASRADVVAARLNKAGLFAAVYPLRHSMQSVTDLKMTVLRRAWRRNQQIERALRARGLATVPLLLVQVGNGDEAMAEAQEFLVRELKVAPHAIGAHSANEPDPVMMAAIANDSSKQVLIFKQSAGTGFDAPRAFVLASTKPVNDADFATQFIGRVMRVAPELQRAYPQADAVPPDLDTAFVFLADARAQSGFADAAKAIAGVQSELGGQIEQLVARRTAFGGVVLTNRPTAQTPLTYDMRLLPTRDLDGTLRAPELLQNPETDAVTPAGLAKTTEQAFEDLPSGASFDMFDMLGETADGDEEGFDSLVADDGTPTLPKPRKALRAPANGEELFAALDEAQLRSFKRRSAMAAHSLPERLVTEAHPLFDVLSLDVCEAAKQLVINDHTQANAVKAALNRMTEKEISTELFTGEVTEDDVQVVTDQHALLERTHDTLATLGLEEQDCIEVIHTLSMRLIGAVEQAWALQDDAASPDPATMRSQARQAACWVIHKQFADLQEVLHSQWATRAKEELAHPLPDALLLPAGVAVEVSRKNMYGLLYPRRGSTASARDALAPASRALLENKTYLFGETGEVLSLACIDGSYEFNASEAAFAEALDLADFVVWWHRNPDRKPYSVGLVRADSKNLFYPDFIVCMTHMPGDAPLMRLVDPKFDTKDASRKAKHQSSFYGKVLFLTEDAKQFKIVEDNGSVGAVVDFDDLASLKSWMRNSQPAPQSK